MPLIITTSARRLDAKEASIKRRRILFMGKLWR
jgi:hypothetical protein